ncbi:ABC-2 type transport system ATP-binding protein [Alkalibacterium putridalgicola]|uniref:ABC transporter ATP-binding protein YhcH n=1 Tax=Alkalibacterium putridalgicola TaxID=426703 RepID=A0A1H7S9T5_9LACT|nr:ABC transporter ATP-binding protein [Alkalibacterium putridalgicola]GEK89114.1 putative ABC transporter ATP-binding protein YhcH [Alkalibacterium putridalgicola]SEL69148.1 ABC-2 type transport system ATP-binding protein [Alkalibacterium putridalgicola]
MTTTIAIDKVGKTINRKEIIKDLSLTINEGEVLGLLGPNGAGKTTLIRMIVGLIDITEGQISVCGHDVENEHRDALGNIGAIVENPEMYPFFSGQKNLDYFARMHNGVSKEKIAELVDFVNLTDRINDKVKDYSLGMKQRLGIAQALMNDPKVLILDEPTNGLDPAGMQELRRHIRMLAKEKNVTVIVSSHLLSEIELMCDRIAIIKKGELIAVENVRDEAKQVYHFKVSEPEKAQVLLQEQFDIISQLLEDYLVVELPAELSDVSSLVKAFVNNGIAIYSVEPKNHSLEDRFLHLTAE